MVVPIRDCLTGSAIYYIEELEAWAQQMSEDNDHKVVFANINFLLSQIRGMGQENSAITQQAQQMQGALQSNNDALKVFLEENDLVMDWQEHLEKLNKEIEEDLVSLNTIVKSRESLKANELKELKEKNKALKEKLAYLTKRIHAIESKRAER